MSSFKLEIVTPERIVYTNDVRMVIVKGVEGELGILPRHIPMVTALRIAPLVVRNLDGRSETIAVHGGFMEVRKDKVVILAESAELAADIDVERARRAKEEAEQRLAQIKQEEIDFKRAQLALHRAMNRIEVAGKE